MPKLFNLLYRRPLLSFKAFFFLFCLSCNAEGFAQIITLPPTPIYKAISTTTISSSVNPSLASLPIMLTATVTSIAQGTPTGMVHFYDNATNTDLTPGGIAISNGTATFVTATLYNSTVFKATYSGDGPNLPDTSANFTQTVNNPPTIIIAGALNPTTTTLVSSANPSIAGFPVTFTATVSTFGTFDGKDSVDFYDVTSTQQLLKTVPLLNG